jgi:lysine-N-methylase
MRREPGWRLALNKAAVGLKQRLSILKSKFHTLPIIEQWDCHGCTACCRETTIQLTAKDLAQLAQQRWDRQPEYQGVRTVRRSFLLGGASVLAHKADGSCVFLTEAGRCRIHELFGADAKPYMCRLFPLQVVATDRDALATVVRSCPSAAADRGRNVAEHLPYLKELLGDEASSDPLMAAPPIVGWQRRGWEDFYRAAGAIERLLVNEQFPLVRRLVHGVRFCNLLEQCKLKRVDTGTIPELLEAMEQLAYADAGHLFQDRAPPAKRTVRLFRRLGAHFIRCVPGGKPIRTLGDQWRVMRASGRLARAKSTLPELHRKFPAINVDQLERPLGPLAGDVLKPLNRFFESHALSKRYSLGQPNDSLVDSFRRLAFAFPMALWLLRWLADGRDPLADDMVQIIVALERGIVLPALNSATRYLAHSGELERLIAWYSR